METDSDRTREYAVDNPHIIMFKTDTNRRETTRDDGIATKNPGVSTHE